MKYHFAILMVTCHVFQESQCQYLNVRDTSHHVLSRQKRWLVWKEGVNWASIILGIGIPAGLQHQSVTFGMLAKAYYEIPNNSSDYTQPSINIERKKRSATRWALYENIQGYLERNGYGDGKTCLLKSICEAASAPLEEKSGILAEILHTVLTPSTTDDEIESHMNNEYFAAEQLGKRLEDCAALFYECDSSVLEQFSRIFH